MRGRRNGGTGERGDAGTGESGTSTSHRSFVPTFLGYVRRVAGMPDYEAYLEHLRRSHPDRVTPSEREFYEDFLRSRYEDGPARCC